MFSMHNNFHYDSENWVIAKFSLGLRNFHYHCEIFAILAKISLCYSKNPSLLFLPSTSSSLHFITSSLIFLPPMLDEITEKLCELIIQQQNYDVKIEMLVEVNKTCKTTKNNLETKLVVLMDLHMSIGLINMTSTQKALKTYLK